MKMEAGIRALAEVTAYQDGMVTSAQARELAVDRLTLARLADAAHLVRLAHGVYRDAGAPSGEHDDLRAAWLSTEPQRLAEERLRDSPVKVVIAGESATMLHQIGDFYASRHEFVVAERRQTQRPEIRYRRRELDPADITVVEGMPVMTIERTIADLVEERQDLSLVADALRDATHLRNLDLDHLRELLDPLAHRNGHARGDGDALLNQLMRIAAIDNVTKARRIAADPELGPRVVWSFLERIQPNIAFATPEVASAFQELSGQLASLAPHVNLPPLVSSASVFDFSQYVRLPSHVETAIAHQFSPQLRPEIISTAHLRALTEHASSEPDDTDE